MQDGLTIVGNLYIGSSGRLTDGMDAMGKCNGEIIKPENKEQGHFLGNHASLPSLPGAGVTNCHIPGGLKQQKWILVQCGGQ